MDDYLSAEQLIIDRLKDKVILVNPTDIQPTKDAGKESAVSQRNKVIFVQLFDDQPVTGETGHAADHEYQLYEQLWLIVVSTRNVGDDSGQKARAVAGPIIAAVKKALQGCELSPLHEPLIANRGPYRPIYFQGAFIHPMIFKTQVSVMADWM